MQTNSVAIGHVHINYAKGGQGEPLVLLHGGSAAWHAWDSILPELTEQFCVYALDLRGHGLSAHTPDAYTVGATAGDVVGFIERVIHMPTHLIGHSWGAQVAAAAAALLDTRVTSLVLMDTPLSLSRLQTHIEANRPVTEQWRDLAATQLSEPEIAARLRDMHFPTPQGPVAAAEILGNDHPWFGFMAYNLAHHDPAFLSAILDDFDATHAAFTVAEVFPRISCPTLLLQGAPAHGGLLTDEEVAWGLSLLPNGYHLRLEGVSHTMHNENPERVIAALQNFWKANMEG